MSYLQYWKLAHAPFDPASRDNHFFEGGSIEEAIARIGFLISSRRQLGVLIGPPSVGKTCLMRRLPRRIDSTDAPHRSRTIYQSLLGVHRCEFYLSLARSLGEGIIAKNNDLRSASKFTSENEAWTILQDTLRAEAALGVQVVLLLDDISSAEEPTLQGIHRILESQTPLSCILSVCPERVDMMPDSLQERCQLRVDLPPWDLGQTADYFDFALSKAQGRPGIFEAQAITRIHELSDGLPQRLNRLSELALIAGATKRVPRVTSELVDQVFEEFSLFQSSPYQLATHS